MVSDSRVSAAAGSKVLFLAPRLFSAGSTGGGERYPSFLLQSLAKNSELSIRAVVGESYTSIREVKLPSMEQIPCSLRTLQRAVLAADIVHIHQLNSHVADLGLSMSIWSQARVVLTDYGGGWRNVGRVAGHHRLRIISGLAAISNTSVADLGWSTTRPVEVLYGGGDHLPQVEINSGEKCYDFLYVGRILPHKGVHLLLKALPKGATCLVAGAPMSHEYLEYLHRLADGHNVMFKLAASDEEIAYAYRTSRWCVSPTLSTLNGRTLSRPELLGITPIESIVAGTPIVLSDIPAYRELAGLVGAELFSANSITDLTKVLARCMNGLSTFSSVNTIASEFTWAKVGERTQALYERVLS